MTNTDHLHIYRHGSSRRWPLGAVGDQRRCTPVSSTMSRNVYSTASDDYEMPLLKNSCEIFHLVQQAFRKEDMEVAIDNKIGNGKYSKVYKGRDVRYDRDIAVKLIDMSELSEEVRAKFIPREISCWRRLSHPFIVRMFAQYELSNLMFLVMEYGSRGDLLRYVQRHGAIGERLAGKFMWQLLVGLSYMHEMGIAHRDIKLENIILFDDGIKISDFGFVREISKNEMSQTFCGSKAYSAPELLRGDAYDPFISDVWSAGVVGFVMLTDSMPFNENLSNSVMVEYQKSRRYHFSSILSLSLECRRTIEMMMTYDVDFRPSVDECLRMPWIRAARDYFRF